jgi:hypothetical protein
LESNLTELYSRSSLISSSKSSLNSLGWVREIESY